MKNRSPLYVLIFALLALPVWAGGHYVQIPGGSFHSALRIDGNISGTVTVAAFRMRTEPVTNEEFLAFVRRTPSWRRDRIPVVFAMSAYLSHWTNPLTPGTGGRQPVVWISWFAARAYCASEGARLPRWTEWEYAAAADATRRDARSDASWRARTLAHLTSRFGDASEAHHEKPDVYGVRDVHALVAEWVDDYAAMFVDTDTRNGGESNLLRLCGGAAAAFADRTDYALLMRVATLAALKPADSSGNVGFRCVKNGAREEHV